MNCHVLADVASESMYFLRERSEENESVHYAACSCVDWIIYTVVCKIHTNPFEIDGLLGWWLMIIANRVSRLPKTFQVHQNTLGLFRNAISTLYSTISTLTLSAVEKNSPSNPGRTMLPPVVENSP